MPKGYKYITQHTDVHHKYYTGFLTKQVFMPSRFTNIQVIVKSISNLTSK